MRVRDLYAAGVAGAEAELQRRERDLDAARAALDAIPGPDQPAVGTTVSVDALWIRARWEDRNARRRAVGRDAVHRHNLRVQEAADDLRAARRRLEMVDRVIQRRARAEARIRSRRQEARLEDDWRARRE